MIVSQSINVNKELSWGNRTASTSLVYTFFSPMITICYTNDITEKQSIDSGHSIFKML